MELRKEILPRAWSELREAVGSHFRLGCHAYAMGASGAEEQ